MNTFFLEDDAHSAESISNLLARNNFVAQAIPQKSKMLSNNSMFLNNFRSKIEKSLNEVPKDLLQKIKSENPFILSTDFEQYAIVAIKINPEEPSKEVEETSKSTLRYHSVSLTNEQIKLKPTLEGDKKEAKKFKNRFLVKTGNSISFKNVEEVAYFFADDKIVYLVANDGKKYIVDYKLEELETLLDPQNFHRLNRKHITSISAIQKMKTLPNNRMQVFLKPNFEQEVFISKEKVSEFKAWLDQ